MGLLKKAAIGIGKRVATNKLHNFMVKDKSDEDLKKMTNRANKLRDSGNSLMGITGYNMRKASEKEQMKRMGIKGPFKQLRYNLKSTGSAWGAIKKGWKDRKEKRQVKANINVWKNGLTALVSFIGTGIALSNRPAKGATTINSKLLINNEVNRDIAKAQAEAQSYNKQSLPKIPMQSTPDQLQEIYAKGNTTDDKLDAIIRLLNQQSKIENDTRKNTLANVKLAEADYIAKANRSDRLLKSLQKLQGASNNEIQSAERLTNKRNKPSIIEIISEAGNTTLQRLINFVKLIGKDIFSLLKPQERTENEGLVDNIVRSFKASTEDIKQAINGRDEKNQYKDQELAEKSALQKKIESEDKKEAERLKSEVSSLRAQRDSITKSSVMQKAEEQGLSGDERMQFIREQRLERQKLNDLIESTSQKLDSLTNVNSTEYKNRIKKEVEVRFNAEKEAKKKDSGTSLLDRILDRDKKKKDKVLDNILSTVKTIERDQKKNFGGILKTLLKWGVILSGVYLLFKGGQGLSKLLKPVGDRIKAWWEKSGAKEITTSITSKITEVTSDLWKKFTTSEFYVNTLKPTLDSVKDSLSNISDFLELFVRNYKDTRSYFTNKGGTEVSDWLKNNGYSDVKGSELSKNDIYWFEQLKGNKGWIADSQLEEFKSKNPEIYESLSKSGLLNHATFDSTPKKPTILAGTKTPESGYIDTSRGGFAGTWLGQGLKQIYLSGKNLFVPLSADEVQYQRSAHLGNQRKVKQARKELDDQNRLIDLDKNNDGIIDSLDEFTKLPKEFRDKHAGYLSYNDYRQYVTWMKDHHENTLLQESSLNKLGIVADGTRRIGDLLKEYNKNNGLDITGLPQRGFTQLQQSTGAPVFPQLQQSTGITPIGHVDGTSSTTTSTIIAGEAGRPELVIKPNGEVFITAAEPTKYENLPVGTKIFRDANSILRSNKWDVIDGRLISTSLDPNKTKEKDLKKDHKKNISKVLSDQNWPARLVVSKSTETPKSTAGNQQDAISQPLKGHNLTNDQLMAIYIADWLSKNTEFKSRAQQAGIIGVLKAESGLDPKIRGYYSKDERTDVGLAQWCRERADNLVKYHNELHPDDKISIARDAPIDSQLGFMYHEMQGRSEFMRKMREAKTPYEAADYMLRGFENGGPKRMSTPEQITNTYRKFGNSYEKSINRHESNAEAVYELLNKGYDVSIVPDKVLAGGWAGSPQGIIGKNTNKSGSESGIFGLISNIKNWLFDKSSKAGDALYESANTNDGILKRLNDWWGRKKINKEPQIDSSRESYPQKSASSTWRDSEANKILSSRISQILDQRKMPVKSPDLSQFNRVINSQSIIKAPIVTPDTEQGPQQSTAAKQLEMMAQIEKSLTDQPWNTSHDSGTSIGQIRGGDSHTTIINNNMVIDDAKTVEMRNNQ